MLARSDSILRKPVSPQRGPYEVEVEEGQTYLWCRCGRSADQPWCDGSHKGTGFQPVSFVAHMSATFFMCGCKESDNPPFCFGNCTGNARSRRQNNRVSKTKRRLASKQRR